MILETKKNPGLSRDEILEWIEKIGCRNIGTDKLQEGLFYIQLIGEPDISVKLFIVMKLCEDFVVKAIVVDIIHNNDVIEHEHHFKWGVFPDTLDSRDLYLVPSHVGAEFLSMAQFYSQSEDHAWG